MFMQQLKCCAFYELSGLNEHVKVEYDSYGMTKKYGFDPIPAITHVWTLYLNGKPIYFNGLLRNPNTNEEYRLANSRKKPFVLFTGVSGTQATPTEAEPNPMIYPVPCDYGKIFAEYIVENKLGTIVVGPTGRNWTGSIVTGYIWAVDWSAMEKFIAANNIIVEPAPFSGSLI